MKKLFLGFIVAAFLVGSIAYAKQKTYPTMTENGQVYYLYKVQKSEGLYSISQRFNVPQALIIEANPGVENGLKLGQQIKVPKVEEQTTKEQPDSIAATIKVGKNQHIVKAKETLYSLSKKYHCTVDELLDLNPWATHLTIGSVLQIPAKKSKKDNQRNANAEVGLPNNILAKPDSTTTTNALPATQIPAADSAKATSQQPLSFKKQNIWEWFTKDSIKDSVLVEDDSLVKSEIKVAILLPFMLDAPQRDASMDRFVDFYQGCLLAADIMAKTGISTTFYTYDIGRDAASLQNVLSNPSLANADLIIGPAYKDQVGAVATYASQQKIPTVIPFTSNVEGIHNNPYLFEVVTPQKNFYSNLLHKFMQLFSDKHPIIVQPKLATHNNRDVFVNQLKDSLQANNLSYTTISDYNLAKTIDSVAIKNPTQECVVIMPTTHGVALSKLGEVMNQVRKTNVALLAFPEWNNVGVDELYSTKVYQFSNYYTSFSNPQIIKFYHAFKQKFGVPKSIQQTPNFALFGFDITCFFLKQFQHHGPQFISSLPTNEVSGLQMNFLFQQVDNGGHWNVGTIIKQIDKEGITDL